MTYIFLVLSPKSQCRMSDSLYKVRSTSPLVYLVSQMKLKLTLHGLTVNFSHCPQKIPKILSYVSFLYPPAYPLSSPESAFQRSIWAICSSGCQRAVFWQFPTVPHCCPLLSPTPASPHLLSHLGRAHPRSFLRKAAPEVKCLRLCVSQGFYSRW